MKLNYGKSHKSGNPGSANQSHKDVMKNESMGVPNANKGKSKKMGNPGTANPRKGNVEATDSLKGNSYGGTTNRGDNAVMSGKAKMGNPGYVTRPGAKVQKHEMFMG